MTLQQWARFCCEIQLTETEKGVERSTNVFQHQVKTNSSAMGEVEDNEDSLKRCLHLNDRSYLLIILCHCGDDMK